MLNMDEADAARNRLKTAVDSYNDHAKQVGELSIALYNLRRESSESLIGTINDFVNRLATAPKEFSKAFAEYEIEFQKFDGVVNATDATLRDIKVNGGTGAGVGVVGGTATAFLAPTAVMAIATTFGTASTGTAIASLSGAAATNAALAWLGGGAIVAGGGGMSAGSALLALAGPIGWGLAGLAAVGSATYIAYSNSQAIKEANDNLTKVETGICVLKAAAREIIALRDMTQEHASGIRALFAQLRKEAPVSYDDFTMEQKSMLLALVNHVRSLSCLLNKTITTDAT